MHHFYYWRVAPGDIPAVLEQTRHWQQQLALRWVKLDPRLYVRREARHCTVMESYCLEAQDVDALAHQLREEGDRISAAWRLAERVLEPFALVDG